MFMVMKLRKQSDDLASLWSDAADVSLVWSMVFHASIVLFTLLVYWHLWLVFAVLLSFGGAAAMSVTWRVCATQALAAANNDARPTEPANDETSSVSAEMSTGSSCRHDRQDQQKALPVMHNTRRMTAVSRYQRNAPLLRKILRRRRRST